MATDGGSGKGISLFWKWPQRHTPCPPICQLVLSHLVTLVNKIASLFLCPVQYSCSYSLKLGRKKVAVAKHSLCTELGHKRLPLKRKAGRKEPGECLRGNVFAAETTEHTVLLN